MTRTLPAEAIASRIAEIDDLFRQLRAKIADGPFAVVETLATRQKIAQAVAEEQAAAMQISVQTDFLAAAIKLTKHRAEFLNMHSRGSVRAGYTAIDHNSRFAAAPLVGDMVILKADPTDGTEGFYFSGETRFETHKVSTLDYTISVAHGTPTDCDLFNALEPSDDFEAIKIFFKKLQAWDNETKAAVIIWIRDCGEEFDPKHENPTTIPITAVPGIAAHAGENWHDTQIGNKPYRYLRKENDT